MNKIQKFPNLEIWCKQYYETVGLKVHPSNVPVDVLLDELVGKNINLAHNQSTLQSVLQHLNTRVGELEQLILKLNDTLLESKAPSDKKTKVKK